jgi:flavin-dependent dehydrogenase
MKQEMSKAMNHIHVVIIGAGVAGSIFAMHAPSNLSMCIIDKKKRNQREEVFKKPCGGLLSPDAQKTLSKLKMSLPLDVCVSPQMFSVKTMDLDQNLTRHYQRHYINIHRHRFDLWLASQIPSYVNFIDDATVKSIDFKSIPHILVYERQGVEYSITFDVCIGADGAKSLARSYLNAPKIRQYLAIQEHFKLDSLNPHLGCFFSKYDTDSYGWFNVKDNHLEFGAALPLHDSLKRYESLKSKLLSLGYPLDVPLLKEACLVNSPSRLNQIYLGEKSCLLIGEAAGWISPSSLEGISYAMDSALIAAEAIHHENALKAYKKRSLKLKFKIVLKILKSYVLYTPWIRTFVMKSGIEAIKMKDKH